MTRIKAIAPLRLEPAELVRRQRRYESLAGRDLVISLVNLEGNDAPLRFEEASDIEASEELTALEMLRTDPQEFDLILPDCVLDPGISRREESPVPCVGILELAVGALHSFGVRYGAVARNDVISEALRRKIIEYGFVKDLASVEVLDIDFCFVSDHEGWTRAMEPVAQSLMEREISVLINGCSAVDMANRRVNGVVVVDPTELALSSIATLSAIGLVGAGSPLGQS